MIDFIKNVLEFDSLFFPSFVTDVSGYPIRQAVEEESFLHCLTHCTVSKLPEDGRPHLYGGGSLRSRIKLSCDRRSVSNLVDVCRNRMYKLMVTAAVQYVG